MDEFQKENWAKVKAHLEEVGQTENMFYKRACAICKDLPDPMEHPPLTQDCDQHHQIIYLDDDQDNDL